MDIVPECVTIADLATHMENTFKPLAGQKGLDLTIHISDDCPSSIYADTLRLQQILKTCYPMP